MNSLDARWTVGDGGNRSRGRAAIERRRREPGRPSSAAALALLLGLVLPFAPAERADALTPKLATAGEVGPASGPGTHYVLLTWQPLEGFVLSPAHAIYRKPGPPESEADFQWLGVVQPTADAASLTLLLDQAAAAGFPPADLDLALTGLAGGPPAGATLADRLAAMLLAPLSPEKQQILFDVLPRLQPPMAMAMGRAFLAQVPATELSTFEIRAYDTATGTEGDVVGRVTTGMAPALLPPPGSPVEKIETGPRGHLSVRLRWCTPVELSHKALHVSGYNVYRALRSAWMQAHGVAPPAKLDPAALAAAVQAGLLVQVNRGPVAPPQQINCLGLVASDTFFVTDNHDSAAVQRFEAGGEPFVPGEQVTYYVAALDHFRRPGVPSPGLDVVVCDRMPPRVPKHVRVENRYDYDSGTKQSSQHLLVSWDREEPAEVSHYWVYRWDSHDAALRHAADPSISNRLARLSNVGAAARMGFVDDGEAQLPAAPPPPTLPQDAGRTFWYTVRAEDDTACKSQEGQGNLSGPGAPAFGVLRDWTGPGTPDGRLQARCCAVTGSLLIQTPQLTSNAIRILLNATDPRVSWAEVAPNFDPATIRRYSLENAWPAPVPLTLDLSMLASVHARVRFGMRSGQVSDWIAGPAFGSTANLPLHTWTASVSCPTYAWPCGGGLVDPVDPGTGEVTGVCGEVSPGAGAVEWRVYRRTGRAGPLVQIESGKFPETAWCDSGTPSVPSTLCYYAQTFDLDGNPSAIASLGCVESLGTEPMPKPEITRATVVPSTNPAPVLGTAAVEWFCPPPGVERFELAFQPPPPGSPGIQWMIVPGAQEMIGTEYGVFPSPRVPAGFGSGGSEFGQTVSLRAGVEYRVRVRATYRAVSEDGEASVATGPWSDEVPVHFMSGLTPGQPDVPWPARHVPGIHPEFAPLAEYDAQQETGRVEIGTIPEDRVITPGTDTNPPRIRGGSLAPYLTVPLPFVAYRHETSPGHRSEMTQVTQYVDGFLVALQGPVGNPVLVVNDALLLVKRRNGDGSGPYRLWIRDTQPVTGGKAYRYTFVRHREDREIAEVLASTTVEIPQ